MAQFRQIVSTQLQSVWYGTSPMRWLLWPVSCAYRLAMSTRRYLYQHQIFLRTETLPKPVVVVGNITAGGTGKTPLVVWLATQFGVRGRSVGVISRGYGGHAKSWPQDSGLDSDAWMVGDEATLLAQKTGCPVVVGPDRVAAAKRLLEQHDVDLILSDDGLQHYRLGRTVELAVVDGVRGLGNRLCLPAGPLRELPSRLREVDAIIVNEGDWGHGGVLRSHMVARQVYSIADGIRRSLGDFKGQTVHAVAGIGHPERFFDLLERHGLIVEPHPLPDHAEMSETDLIFADTDPVLITEKDAAKCGSFSRSNVWCVVAELEFAARDGERLMGLIERQLAHGSRSG